MLQRDYAQRWRCRTTRRQPLTASNRAPSVENWPAHRAVRPCAVDHQQKCHRDTALRHVTCRAWRPALHTLPAVNTARPIIAQALHKGRNAAGGRPTEPTLIIPQPQLSILDDQTLQNHRIIALHDLNQAHPLRPYLRAAKRQLASICTRPRSERTLHRECSGSCRHFLTIRDNPNYPPSHAPINCTTCATINAILSIPSGTITRFSLSLT